MLKKKVQHVQWVPRPDVDLARTHPIGGSVVQGDEASFVLRIDVSPMLQEILRHLQVVVASYRRGET